MIALMWLAVFVAVLYAAGIWATKNGRDIRDTAGWRGRDQTVFEHFHDIKMSDVDRRVDLMSWSNHWGGR